MGLAAGVLTVGSLIGLVGWTLGSASAARPQQARLVGPGYPRRRALPDGPPTLPISTSSSSIPLVDVDLPRPTGLGNPGDPQRSQ